MSRKTRNAMKRLEKRKSKLDKAENKLFKAQDKIPEVKKANKKARKEEKSKLEHREKKSKLSFDEDRPKNSDNLKGKATNSDNLKGRPKKLEDLKKPTSNLAHSVKTIPKKKVVQNFHKEIEKSENDNIGIKSIHSTEKGIEFTGKKISQIRRHQKLKPYKKLVKAENKATKAIIKHEYEKVVAENPHINSNPISKFQQKRAIKKQYAKTYRSTYKTTGKTIKATGKKGVDLIKKAGTLVAKNPKVIVIILAAMLLIFIITSFTSSVSTFMQGALNSFVGTSYTSENEDILEVEDDYLELENEVKQKVNNIESDYPGYDEYRLNIAETGHNPHELAALLTAMKQTYTSNSVSSDLERILELQYSLTIESEIEIRYKTETRTDTWTDSDGNTHTDTYTVQVPYEYLILNVTLNNNSIDTVAREILNAEQLEMYEIYRETKGNKPDLFPDSMQSSVPPINYQIPGDALTDPQFAALMQEAQKYIGYEYKWGGSHPSTSFDCSGFIYWVLNASGTANVSRTTAQGYFNQSAVVSPSEAKPGDLIFFQGTYATSDTVTHIGIYVGNGMMIHAGNPIGYADVNSSFWSSHFYSYGRIVN